MKYALNLAEDGRVLSATYERFAAEGQAIVDALPEGRLSEYQYINGAFVHNPLPAVERPAPVNLAARLAELEEAFSLLVEGATE